MKSMLALFLFVLIFSAANSFAIDIGDGSDGACAVVGPADTLITAAKKSYQCTTLTIDGPLTAFAGGQAGAGGTILLIKVQDLVTVAGGGSINLSGANGADGNTIGNAAGGAAGAGGSAGGSSTATNGANGSGSGSGAGGAFATANGGAIVGGGGGGASYQTVSTLAVPGDANGTPIAAGANGLVYGPEINFDSSFSGGSGGGAGGTSLDTSVPTTWFGGAGGGGGGAIRIVAGGNIQVDGSIISDGGNGGGTLVNISPGGGGGGSGGAIWLQAAGAITITGTIQAIGGIHGSNTSGLFGDGGDGGDGRIRLDDADGVVPGVTNPVAYSTTFTPTAITSGTSPINRQYSSAIACGRVSLEDEKPINNLINLALGMLIASMIYFSVSRKGKI